MTKNHTKKQEDHCDLILQYLIDHGEIQKDSVGIPEKIGLTKWEFNYALLEIAGPNNFLESGTSGHRKISETGRNFMKSGGFAAKHKKHEDDLKRDEQIKDFQVSVPISTLRHHDSQDSHSSCTRLISLVSVIIALLTVIFTMHKSCEETNNKSAILQLQQVDSLIKQDITQLQNADRIQYTLLIKIESKIDSDK
jgi:hypothetical protein